MFLAIFVIFVVMWLLGRFAFRVASGFIHVLLVVAVIALLAHFLRG